MKRLILYSVIICFLHTLSFAGTVGMNYSSSKYRCSFTVKGGGWHGNTIIRSSVLKDGLVEYVNTKDLAVMTFSAYKELSGIRHAVDTIDSRIKSHSSRMWILRQRVFNDLKIPGYKQEIGFITTKGVTYLGVVIVLAYKGIQYRFLFTALDGYYVDAYKKFEQTLKTFRVRK